MKKITTILMAVLVMVAMLSACANTSDGNNSNVSKLDNSDNSINSDKISIVTTIFPEYDWVREMLGDKTDNAELTILLDNGVDLHSYQPTADDLIKIANCDMFIYVGGESDEWVEDALKQVENKDMAIINLLDVLGDSVKTEETVEGMQEEEHEHSHDEKISEEDIEDRTLYDFNGEWKSLYPYLLNGDLDEYCEDKANDDDDSSTTKDTYKEKYEKSWLCDADKIKVSGDSITFTYTDGKTVSATYTYAGYQTKTNDEGEISSVRYQFKTDNANAPQYVQFNDHGHEPGEAEHFHIYFGNDSFDTLMDSETNPFFVKESLSSSEILEDLMGHEHEEEKDEHVWLSLRNAQVLCREIAKKLSEIDGKNAEVYSANADAYIEKLSDLDNEYKTAVNAADKKTLLFGDRFPFRYLVDDYGLDYFAAFVGCSAETEASFETIAFLANKVDELGLSSVLTIEGTEHKIAETVISNTSEKNQKVLTMDSLQSMTSDDAENGMTYLSVMEQNLEVLKEALK